MHTIHINKKELWDEEKEQFVYVDEQDIQIEHSLVSMSEWESKYHKSFINTDKTVEETLDYIHMMVVGDKPPEDTFYSLSKSQLEEIGDYINNPMTATIINEDDEEKIKSSNINGKFTSSEEIYSWMVALQIPFECQYWHINRLIILIKLCAINAKPKDDKNKNKKIDLASRRARMIAARQKYKK